jgi:hypothetical protein
LRGATSGLRGQGVGLIKDLPTVAELVRLLKAVYAAAL